MNEGRKIPSCGRVPLREAFNSVGNPEAPKSISTPALTASNAALENQGVLP